MLHIKSFGPNGTNVPLPAWADDHASFLDWALCPDEERPAVAGSFSPTPITWEEREKLFNTEETYQAVVWATPTPTGYALGWGSDRILIHAKHSLGPHIALSNWNGRVWLSCFGDILAFIPSKLLQLLGIDSGINVSGSLLDNKRNYNVLTIEDAPWSNERLCSWNWNIYRSKADPSEPRIVNAGVSDEQLPAFYAWLSHRFRDMARRIPELRALWLASRVSSQRYALSLHEFLSLWKTIQINPSLQQSPLLLMAYAAHPHRLPQVISPRLSDHHHSGASWRWHELGNAIDLFQDPRYVLFSSSPLQRGAFKKSRKMGLAAAYRWTSALNRPLKNKPKSVIAPIYVLELLLAYCPHIPSKEKITALINSSFTLWAWLASQTDWTTTEVNEAWPKPHTGITIDTWYDDDFIDEMEDVRCFQQANPDHFQTIAQAALAWIRHGSMGENEEDPDELLERLKGMTIPEAVRKERVNKRLTWLGVVALVKHLDQETLKATEDFTLAHEPQHASEDSPWTTALGTIILEGFHVHPLCRPSHLNTMGEFLINCAQKSRSLDGFVRQARSEQSRFFRISGQNREFLLQINLGDQAWKVEELRGRKNHAPTPEAAAVGKRVAELYTLLTQEGLVPSTQKAPLPACRGGIPSEDPYDIVEMVRQFTHDLDDDENDLRDD